MKTKILAILGLFLLIGLLMPTHVQAVTVTATPAYKSPEVIALEAEIVQLKAELAYRESTNYKPELWKDKSELRDWVENEPKAVWVKTTHDCEDCALDMILAASLKNRIMGFFGYKNSNHIDTIAWAGNRWYIVNPQTHTITAWNTID